MTHVLLSVCYLYPDFSWVRANPFSEKRLLYPKLFSNIEIPFGLILLLLPEDRREWQGSAKMQMSWWDARIFIQILIDYHPMESEWCVWKTKPVFFCHDLRFIFHHHFILRGKKRHGKGIDPLLLLLPLGLNLYFVIWRFYWKRNTKWWHQFQLYDIHLSWKGLRNGTFNKGFFDLGFIFFLHRAKMQRKSYLKHLHIFAQKFPFDKSPQILFFLFIHATSH